MATQTGMRRRGSAANGDAGNERGTRQASSVSKLVKNFDMYATVKEEYQEKVPASAAASSFAYFSWGLTALLVLSELVTFYTADRTKEHMLVDTSLGQKLQINMNISFPALQCSRIHVDAMDVAGDYHPYMEQNLVKQRLSPEGVPVGQTVEEKANVYEDKMYELPADYCGSCYGAEAEPGDCCNTCSEVVGAYSMKGWATKDIRRDSEQCKREQLNPMAASKEGEGCNLSGFMLVNKVAGNFHVALGESTVRDGRFIHQFQPEDAKFFNASHVVHSLSFGLPYPGMPPNPLDGMNKLLSEDRGTGLVQYFIKIVPTIYEDKVGEKLMTNQFSFTERFRPLAQHLGGHPDYHSDHNMHGSAPAGPARPASNGKKQNAIAGGAAAVATTVLPGVFWVYDLSPFMVDVSAVKVPLAHLAARLCAIAGGVSLLTSTLHAATAAARRVLRV